MKRAALALLALLTLGLGMPGAASAQISDDVVRIGVISDLSGVYAYIGGMPQVEAARMAVDDFGGTVLGKPIEIVIADHQSKPDIAVVKARKWIEVEGVDLIASGSTSSTGLALQELSRQLETVLVHSGPSTSRLTNEDCSPFAFHWIYDTHAVAVGTASALLARGGLTWYFLQVDYAFGQSMVDDVTPIIEAAGGELLGTIAHPFPTTDFASFLLQAQASCAQIIGLANAGQDLVTSVKQAQEFGITASGQKLAAMVVFIADIYALGADTAQGLTLTTGFYWDRDPISREFSLRYLERAGKMPGQTNAGMYSAVNHYLRAVEAAGTDEAGAVAAMMHALPIEGEAIQHGFVRADGRSMNDMYLVEVKSPEESTGEWDLYRILETIPAERAARPLSQSVCPLITGATQ
jgi:branched-chain amino acid transport system substrate-binding protein